MFLLPQGDLISAMVVFSAIYFIVPLVLGGTLFVVAEIVLRPEDSSQRAVARQH